jgi:hypothetical protein
MQIWAHEVLVAVGMCDCLRDFHPTTEDLIELEAAIRGELRSILQATRARSMTFAGFGMIEGALHSTAESIKEHAPFGALQFTVLAYLADKNSVWLDGDDAATARALVGMGLAQGYEMPDGGFSAAVSSAGRLTAEYLD